MTLLKTELVTRSLDAASNKFRLLSISETLVKVSRHHEETDKVTKDTSKELKLQLNVCDSNMIIK